MAANSAEDVAPILANVGPKTPYQTFKYYAVMAVVGWGAAVKMFMSFLRSPGTFSKRTDRSYLDHEEQLPGVVHEYLDVNGIKLHAASLGRDKSKPLMLFLHGFPDHWYTWRKQLVYYKEKGYDAVAVDMRGYNLSSKPKGVDSYRMDIIASDIAKAVKALGHQKCILVGHDWGGIIANVTAAMYPEVIERLILMATGHPGLFWVNATNKQLKKSLYILLLQIPFLSELGCSESDYKMMDVALTPKSQVNDIMSGFTPKDVQIYKRALARPGALTGGLMYYRAAFRWAMWPTCYAYQDLWRAVRRKLKMPTCVIMAEKDPFIEPYGFRGLEQVADVSEQHVIEGVGHWLHCQAPDKVHQVIDRFLASHPVTDSQKTAKL